MSQSHSFSCALSITISVSVSRCCNLITSALSLGPREDIFACRNTSKLMWHLYMPMQVSLYVTSLRYIYNLQNAKPQSLLSLQVSLLGSMRHLGLLPGPAWHTAWYSCSMPLLIGLAPAQLGGVVKMAGDGSRRDVQLAPTPQWLTAAWGAAGTAHSAAAWALGKQLGGEAEGQRVDLEGARCAGAAAGSILATLARLLTLGSQHPHHSGPQQHTSSCVARLTQQQHVLAAAHLIQQQQQRVLELAHGHVGHVAGAVRDGRLPVTAALQALHEMRGLHPLGVKALQSAAQQLLLAVVARPPAELFASVWGAAAVEHKAAPPAAAPPSTTPWAGHAATLVLTSGQGCRRSSAPLPAEASPKPHKGPAAATAAGIAVELVAGLAGWGCQGLTRQWVLAVVQQCTARITHFTGPQAAMLLRSVALVHSQGLAGSSPTGLAAARVHGEHEAHETELNEAWKRAVQALLNGALPALCAQAGHTQLAEVAWALSTLQVGGAGWLGAEA